MSVINYVIKLKLSKLIYDDIEFDALSQEGLSFIGPMFVAPQVCNTTLNR